LGAVAAGKAKASASWAKIFKLGVVSGCHIGFGAYLAITVGGACPGLATSNPGLQKVSLISSLAWDMCNIFERFDASDALFSLDYSWRIRTPVWSDHDAGHRR
jgi:hypothetical protein